MARIIAGSHRGRRLATPDGQGTRPTSDRVREAVFAAMVSWLGAADADPAQAFAGQGFADLYAGSGAMALEAASRGASPVLLVERDRKTAAVARGNAETLGLTAAIRVASVEVLAAEPAATPYDIIWLDPPYELATERLDRVLADLIEHGWLVSDGMLVVERSARSSPPTWPEGFGGWTKRYGETEVHFAGPERPGEPERIEP